MTETESPARRPRAREIGLVVGDLPTGRDNAITDVPGVRVGHATLCEGSGPLRPGAGPVRTGVTVIRPHPGNLFREKVRAAVETINGLGKVVGFEQVRELGLLESPIALTNTLNVGLVADALIEHAIRESPEIGVTAGTVSVVVGETNDGYLNDIQGRHVRAEQVWAALRDAADGPVAEGAVGAGLGTSCFGWKGGIGTASRRLPTEAGGYTLGALVQSNFGRPSDLTICGVPVGRHVTPPGIGGSAAAERGSVMIVLATDAPLESRQLRRLSARATAGLARTGSHLGHESGDFVIAFSTAHRIPHASPTPTRAETVVIDEGRVMQWVFPAVVESVEEAVLNSLFRAVTVRGRDDHVRHALPLEDVARLVMRDQSGRV
jgi:D-aminopeptidase